MADLFNSERFSAWVLTTLAQKRSRGTEWFSAEAITLSTGKGLLPLCRGSLVQRRLHYLQVRACLHWVILVRRRRIYTTYRYRTCLHWVTSLVTEVTTLPTGTEVRPHTGQSTPTHRYRVCSHWSETSICTVRVCLASDCASLPR